VEAFFESSLVLTFATPKEHLEKLIPKYLELDTFRDKWGFVAVAMVQTRQLRPKGFPRFTGNDFFLVGYRVFVRYRNNAGKNLRGLYILKSETDQKKMELMGNTFTRYDYTTTDIHQATTGGIKEISSNRSNFFARIDTAAKEVALPEQSPFADWKEARRFAGPLPFTFTCNARRKEILIIEGVRQHWTPRPVRVLDYHFSFLDSLHLNKPILANAFIVENTPYYWKKGKKELWK
jgi:uncharacterized protein YqjF (DUF2071 family)